MNRDKNPRTREIALTFEENGVEVTMLLEIQGDRLVVSDLQHAEGFDKLPNDVQHLIMRAHMPIKGSVPLHNDEEQPTYVSPN